MSRFTIRLVGAAACAVMAVIYFAIGLGALEVVDPTTQTDSLLPFGAAAGTLFVIGAVLLATTDRRVLWIVGAILQVGVAILYVAVGQSRTPPFEVWGITLRLIQVPLLAVLVYLAGKAPEGAAVRT